MLNTKTKIKTKLIKLQNWKIQLKMMIFFIGFVTMWICSQVAFEKAVKFIKDPVGQQTLIATVIVPDVKAEKEKKEMEMKEWVLVTVANAGLSQQAVDCLIQHESGWDNWKYGINENGSTDFGLWQINSIHKETASVECRWDYKCATYWAINKRLNDGNWNAWYGYTNYCK